MGWASASLPAGANCRRFRRLPIFDHGLPGLVAVWRLQRSVSCFAGSAASEASAAYAVPEGDDGRRPWLPDADYRSVFGQLTRAAIIGAPPGRLLAANPAACQLLEASEDELRLLGCAPLQDPDDMRWAVAVAERRLNGYVEANLRIRRRNGAIIEVALASSIWLNEEGEERSLILLNEKARHVDTLPWTHLQPQWARAALASRATDAGILAHPPFHRHDFPDALHRENTGKTHVASIYRKLGVHNRAVGLARARALGILRFPAE